MTANGMCAGVHSAAGAALALLEHATDGPTMRVQLPCLRKIDCIARVALGNQSHTTRIVSSPQAKKILATCAQKWKTTYSRVDLVRRGQSAYVQWQNRTCVRVTCQGDASWAAGSRDAWVFLRCDRMMLARSCSERDCERRRTKNVIHP